MTDLLRDLPDEQRERLGEIEARTLPFQRIRFEAKTVVRPDSEEVYPGIGGCHMWTGGKLRDRSGGYGTVSFNGKNRTTHRVSWELHNGPIPDETLVCHRCDVPLCVRIEHLFLGTISDNAMDSVNKGRHHDTQKTQCPQGHEYTEANTYIEKSGSRACRSCRNTRNKARRRSKLGTEPSEHGLVGYRNYGCRCDVCRAAESGQRRAFRTRMKGKEPPHHGAYGYRWYSCRCDVCKMGVRDAARARAARRRLKSEK